jgi:hypothetical protein
MDEHDQLARALRAEADRLRPKPRPDLVLRVHEQLRAERQHPAPHLRLTPWMALAAGIVVAVILALLSQGQRKPVLTAPQPPPESPTLFAQLPNAEAPLTREWTRMRSDAHATAAFLMDALPRSAAPR